MEREILVKKWLKGTLSSAEEKVFHALEDSAQLERLSEAMKDFKSPKYNVEDELHQLTLQKEKPKQQETVRKLVRWLPAAAILVLALTVSFYLQQSGHIIETSAIAQTVNIRLPDHTEVILNAGSELSYYPKKWSDTRSANLRGEAYFKVTKGATFTIETEEGTITVLGTEFNVRQRDDFFEVVCFEGAVKVVHSKKEIVLKPGDFFIAHSNNFKTGTNITLKNPTWLEGMSSFTSAPYMQVLNELERQFDITINVEKIDTNHLFTGSFPHNSIEEALETVTLPLQYSFSKTDKTVTIKRE